MAEQKIALVLGGSLNPERRAAALKGEKPRVDVMEMEARFDAQLFDYEWFTRTAEQDRFGRLLLSIARHFGRWSELLTLRAVWQLRHYEVIYVTGEDIGLPLAFLLRLFGLRRPKLIVRMEQPIFGRNELRRSLFRAHLRSSLPRIQAILCRTEAHVSYLQHNFDFSKTEVFFSPETTDTTFFDPALPPVALQSLKSIPHPFIVSAGLEMRDYETLISAVEGLPVTALICAGSPWAKIQYRPSNSLPDNVLVRSFSQLEMRELYRAAAFVVLPIKPTQRACGMNVILEAWSMGRAVIASRTEGLVSYIQDQTTGCFVTPGDVGELRSAILHLLADPAEAQCLGENGYQRVRRELYLERYLETVAGTIERVSGNGNLVLPLA
ncbi:MAG: glycosyltransferase family 4 protein [Anaerolineales bacterium]|jgi:glycosyltransferase involved in cell wall biosynthesis